MKQRGPWNDPALAQWRCPGCAQTVFISPDIPIVACSDCDIEMERLYHMEETHCIHGMPFSDPCVPCDRLTAEFRLRQPGPLGGVA